VITGLAIGIALVFLSGFVIGFFTGIGALTIKLKQDGIFSWLAWDEENNKFSIKRPE
jgi:hypothetical protein